MQVTGVLRAPGFLLNDAEVMRKWMLLLAAEIGMTIVNGPTIHSFKEPGSSGSGLSGFSIIAESHIAFHTWPEQEWCYGAIVSCKDFDLPKALAITSDLLVGIWAWQEVSYQEIGPGLTKAPVPS